jgi:hypothetical protein
VRSAARISRSSSMEAVSMRGVERWHAAGSGRARRAVADAEAVQAALSRLVASYTRLRVR